MWLRAIHAEHSLSYFGPGYVSRAELTLGIEKWIERNGPYSIIAFDSYLLEYEAIASRKRPFHSSLIWFDESEFYEFGGKLKEFICNYNGIKIFFANWDVYGISERDIHYLQVVNPYVVDASLVKWTIADRTRLFGVQTANFHHAVATDNWVHYIHENKTKIISLPHAIGLDQFSFLPLSNRLIPFSVPGIGYAERIQLYNLMSTRRRIEKIYKKMVDILYRSICSSYSRNRMYKVWAQYDSEIGMSRVAYASGSLFRTPVRKYFEIPALGAVPIGQVCEGFSELGFVDGVNFIVAETPERVLWNLNNLNLDDAQEIANRARCLILEKHSEPARSKQFTESFSRIVNGTFRGSYWENGEYFHA